MLRTDLQTEISWMTNSELDHGQQKIFRLKHPHKKANNSSINSKARYKENIQMNMTSDFITKKGHRNGCNTKLQKLANFPAEETDKSF